MGGGSRGRGGFIGYFQMHYWGDRIMLPVGTTVDGVEEDKKWLQIKKKTHAPIPVSAISIKERYYVKSGKLVRYVTLKV